MKKICVLVFLLVFASCAYSADTIGILGKLNNDEKNFDSDLKNNYDEKIIARVYAGKDNDKALTYRFYDSINQMQLALNAGEINAMSLPDSIADFILTVNPNYALKGATSLKNNMVLVFGFAKNNFMLQRMFNNKK